MNFLLVIYVPRTYYRMVGMAAKCYRNQFYSCKLVIICPQKRGCRFDWPKRSNVLARLELTRSTTDRWDDSSSHEQVKAFERRCRHLYGASPAAKRKRAAEEAAAEAAGIADPCGGFLFAGEG